MMKFYDDFLFAINNKRVVEICVNSKEKGFITRQCIPYDFGPSRRYKDGLDRYHFHDLDSPEGSHTLSILVEQLIDLKILDIAFEPEDYVHWIPNWIVPRDWGRCS